MELEQLQQEITALRREKKVHDAQNRLFEIFINMARSSKEEQMLNVTMQTALDIAAELSGAEKGSLFLLDTIWCGNRQYSYSKPNKWRKTIQPDRQSHR